MLVHFCLGDTDLLVGLVKFACRALRFLDGSLPAIHFVGVGVIQFRLCFVLLISDGRLDCEDVLNNFITLSQIQLVCDSVVYEPSFARCLYVLLYLPLFVGLLT